MGNWKLLKHQVCGYTATAAIKICELVRDEIMSVREENVDILYVLQIRYFMKVLSLIGYSLIFSPD